MHDPGNYPPHPEEAGHQSEPPRFEKKAEVVPVESILDSPGRESRPDRVNIPTFSFIIVPAAGSICLQFTIFVDVVALFAFREYEFFQFVFMKFHIFLGGNPFKVGTR